MHKSVDVMELNNIQEYMNKNKTDVLPTLIYYNIEYIIASIFSLNNIVILITTDKIVIKWLV